MRHNVLVALPLALVMFVVLPARAQNTAYRAASPRAGLLPPVMSDSLATRVRALGLLPSLSLPMERAVTADTTSALSACPMPLQRPDSSRHFAALSIATWPSSDHMPTQASSCVNPLARIGQRP